MRCTILWYYIITPGSISELHDCLQQDRIISDEATALYSLHLYGDWNWDYGYFRWGSCPEKVRHLQTTVATAHLPIVLWISKILVGRWDLWVINCKFQILGKVLCQRKIISSVSVRSIQQRQIWVVWVSVSPALSPKQTMIWKHFKV